MQLNLNKALDIKAIWITPDLIAQISVFAPCGMKSVYKEIPLSYHHSVSRMLSLYICKVLSGFRGQIVLKSSNKFADSIIEKLKAELIKANALFNKTIIDNINVDEYREIFHGILLTYARCLCNNAIRRLNHSITTNQAMLI